MYYNNQEYYIFYNLKQSLYFLKNDCKCVDIGFNPRINKIYHVFKIDETSKKVFDKWINNKFVNISCEREINNAGQIYTTKQKIPGSQFYQKI